MRWLASWILYWLGDAVSRSITLIPDQWVDINEEKWGERGWSRIICKLYAFYIALMQWSIIAQGDGNGAWERADD